MLIDRFLVFFSFPSFCVTTGGYSVTRG